MGSLLDGKAFKKFVDGYTIYDCAIDLLGFTETVIPRRWRVAGLGGVAV